MRCKGTKVTYDQSYDIGIRESNRGNNLLPSPFARKHVKKTFETDAFMKLSHVHLTADNRHLHTMRIAANLYDHGLITLLSFHEVPAFVEQTIIQCIGFELQQILKLCFIGI